MSTFCAGIYSRVNNRVVEFLCTRSERLDMDNSRDNLSYAFPGDKNHKPEESPEEIIKRTFSMKAGILILDFRLVLLSRLFGEDEKILFHRYFWIVTNCTQDPFCVGESEPPGASELVWLEVSKLRNLIVYSHQKALNLSIKTLARINDDLALPLFDACPDLFPVK